MFVSLDLILLPLQAHTDLTHKKFLHPPRPTLSRGSAAKLPYSQSKI